LALRLKFGLSQKHPSWKDYDSVGPFRSIRGVELPSMRWFGGHRGRIVRLTVRCKALREQSAQVGCRIPHSKMVAPRGGVNEMPAVREAPHLVPLSANEAGPGSAKHLLNLFLEFVHDEFP
jgi:hypothetical protein